MLWSCVLIIVCLTRSPKKRWEEDFTTFRLRKEASAEVLGGLGGDETHDACSLSFLVSLSSLGFMMLTKYLITPFLLLSLVALNVCCLERVCRMLAYVALRCLWTLLLYLLCPRMNLGFWGPRMHAYVAFVAFNACLLYDALWYAFFLFSPLTSVAFLCAGLCLVLEIPYDDANLRVRGFGNWYALMLPLVL